MKIDIIGLKEDTSFDVRIFNVSSFIASVLGIILVLINFVNDFPLVLVISTYFTAGSFLVIYYLSRFKKLTQHLKIPFFIVMLVSITYAWFLTEGIMGSTSYLILFSCLALSFFFKKRIFLYLGILITLTVLLILFQLFLPEFILKYPDDAAKFSDNAFTLLAILVISVYTINLFIEYLNREQKIIADQNKKLEHQKEKITAQADELMAVNGKLIEMDKFKEMMTAMVIHDLKNPLSSVIGLSNQPYSDRNMQIIKQSGKQMLNLVMNILDVQKFESAQLKLHCENVMLQDVIAKSIDNIRGLVEEKNLDIMVSGHVGIMVFIDASLVERVFTNILSNAIKYSENNAKINIHGETDPDNQFVKISITDYGSGIDANNLDKVFDKFAQINPKETGSLRSTGLGLAFCKMVVESHKCKIGVVSNPQKSTTFWFTLKKASFTDNNTLIPPIELSEKKEILLDDLDIGYLVPFLTRIKKLKYYESGKLLSVTASMYEEFSPGIAHWKIEMENAIYSNNEFKFNELLKIAKPEINDN